MLVGGLNDEGCRWIEDGIADGFLRLALFYLSRQVIDRIFRALSVCFDEGLSISINFCRRNLFLC